MDSERGVDVGGLQSDLDATRAAISGTAHQLRERMTTTMDWHTYIERYPGSILASAAFVGFVLGRQVAARLGLVRGSADLPRSGARLRSVAERSFRRESR
jgi:hypothetical protein